VYRVEIQPHREEKFPGSKQQLTWAINSTAYHATTMFFLSQPNPVYIPKPYSRAILILSFNLCLSVLCSLFLSALQIKILFEYLNIWISANLIFLHLIFLIRNLVVKHLQSMFSLHQRLQSKVLRTITNAPRYVSNFTLHNDLQIPFITEEIKRYSTLFYNRLIGNENSYVTELSNPLNVRRRLKRQCPSDLKHQRERKQSRRTHNIMHSICRRIIIEWSLRTSVSL
jgi:hypothetical protein